ncbi:Mu-like prophage major head subunit gpT family protein [Nitrospira sp. Nam74]
MPIGQGIAITSNRALIGTFYDRLRVFAGNSWVNRIGMYFESTNASETYGWLGNAPVVREWEGERLHQSLLANNLTIVNKTFEATMEVMVEDLRRDKTGQLKARISDLAKRVASHWAGLITNLINSGAGATYGAAYDGQFFFDTDHAEGNSGTLRNAVTASEIAALDVATATAPTASEMADIILGMIAYFYNLKDDQGEPYNEDAQQFMLMVPPNIWGAAQGAVSANLLNTGSGARDNPLKFTNMSVEVVNNPRLTSTSKIFMFRTDADTRPFILQEEVKPTMSSLSGGSEEEFMRRRHLYGVEAVRNVGYGMWQHALQATLS